MPLRGRGSAAAAFIVSASTVGSLELDGTVPAGAEVAREWPGAAVVGVGVVQLWRLPVLALVLVLLTPPLGVTRVGAVVGATPPLGVARVGAVVGAVVGTMGAHAGVRSGLPRDGASFR